MFALTIISYTSLVVIMLAYIEDMVNESRTRME